MADIDKGDDGGESIDLTTCTSELQGEIDYYVTQELYGHIQHRVELELKKDYKLQYVYWRAFALIQQQQYAEGIELLRGMKDHVDYALPAISLLLQCSGQTSAMTREEQEQLRSEIRTASKQATLLSLYVASRYFLYVNKLEKAKQCCEKALSKNKKHIALLSLYAWIQIRIAESIDSGEMDTAHADGGSGDNTAESMLEKGLNICKKALKYSQQEMDICALMTRVQGLMLQHKVDKALHDIGTTIRIRPSFQAAQDLQIQLLAATDKWQEATHAATALLAEQQQSANDATIPSIAAIRILLQFARLRNTTQPLTGSEDTERFYEFRSVIDSYEPHNTALKQEVEEFSLKIKTTNNSSPTDNTSGAVTAALPPPHPSQQPQQRSRVNSNQHHSYSNSESEDDRPLLPVTSAQIQAQQQKLRENEEKTPLSPYSSSNNTFNNNIPAALNQSGGVGSLRSKPHLQPAASTAGTCSVDYNYAATGGGGVVVVGGGGVNENINTSNYSVNSGQQSLQQQQPVMRSHTRQLSLNRDHFNQNNDAAALAKPSAISSAAAAPDMNQWLHQQRQVEQQSIHSMKNRMDNSGLGLQRQGSDQFLLQQRQQQQQQQQQWASNISLQKERQVERHIEVDDIPTIDDMDDGVEVMHMRDAPHQQQHQSPHSHHSAYQHQQPINAGYPLNDQSAANSYYNNNKQRRQPGPQMNGYGDVNSVNGGGGVLTASQRLARNQQINMTLGNEHFQVPASNYHTMYPQQFPQNNQQQQQYPPQQYAQPAGDSSPPPSQQQQNTIPPVSPLTQKEIERKQRIAYAATQIEQAKQYVKDAFYGQAFIKHGRRGTPHERTVTLEVNGRQITVDWGSGKFTCTKDQLKLVDGKQTAVFLNKSARKAKAELCFSLVTAERTLDLEAKTAKNKEYWFNGLTLLLKYLK